MTSVHAPSAASRATGRIAPREDHLVGMGRAAIATQGVLYALVGVLAVTIAQGDPAGDADQRGALEVIARQPFGKALLVVVTLGLALHALWRALLALRGEPGEDDAKSLAKRAANAGRAVLYVSLTVAGASLVLGQGTGSGSGDSREEGWTATVLGWPAGAWIVGGAGAAIIAAGLWNAWRGASRSFEDKLDLRRTRERARHAIVGLGVAGYIARGAVYGVVGWFLLQAGLTHEPEQTESLDTALREVASSGWGRVALFAIAVGLVTFGVFRVIDALKRRDAEIAWA